ncbi:helix-turn-helix domain-containing protein [Kitasatospora sp. NPDC087315]|uniref:helix-turn-helix domain-containing protein n=1 Tax=Kitasatospora sp. NPDC087315 TaxID=3364069 RepID=UPI003803C54C
MPRRQPTASATRTELGSLLRRLRTRAGLTGPQVAASTGIDPGTLSRYEHGLRKIEPPTAEALLDLYQAPGPARETVVSLVEADASTRSQPSWWRRFPLPDDFGAYLAEEREAVRIRSVEPHLVPGRLQTEEVAAAVISGMRPDLPAHEVADLVDLRMRRQNEVLPAEQHILLGAAALSLLDVTHAARLQLQRLLDAANQPGLTIRVLPPDVCYHPGLTVPFVLMDPPVGGQPSVWVELMDRSVRLSDRAAAAGRYETAFARVESLALTAAETQDHLARLIEESP